MMSKLLASLVATVRKSAYLRTPGFLRNGTRRRGSTESLVPRWRGVLPLHLLTSPLKIDKGKRKQCRSNLNLTTLKFAEQEKGSVVGPELSTL